MKAIFTFVLALALGCTASTAAERVEVPLYETHYAIAQWQADLECGELDLHCATRADLAKLDTQRLEILIILQNVGQDRSAEIVEIAEQACLRFETAGRAVPYELELLRSGLGL